MWLQNQFIPGLCWGSFAVWIPFASSAFCAVTEVHKLIVVKSEEGLRRVGGPQALGSCHQRWWLCSFLLPCVWPVWADLLQLLGQQSVAEGSSWACFEGRQCLPVLLVALLAGDTRHRGCSIPSLWSRLQNPQGSLTVTVTNFLLCFFPFFPPFV